MHIKIFLKKLTSICVAVMLAVTQTACFDLGDFSDDSAYYSAFGRVRLVYDAGVEEKDIEYKDYDVEDYFYNKNTGENFSYGNPKDEEPDEGKTIPKLPYLYMAIPVNQTLNIESVALYFNASTTCSLEVFFYVVKELPDGGNFTNVRVLGEPEYPQNSNQDGETTNKKEYTDPDDAFFVGRKTVSVQNGQWVPLMMSAWDNGKMIEVEHYLLLRFVNNGGANTDTEKKPPVSFCVTNLLIRAFS